MILLKTPRSSDVTGPSRHLSRGHWPRTREKPFRRRAEHNAAKARARRFPALQPRSSGGDFEMADCLIRRQERMLV
jgi:hypothetical protein